LCFGLLGVPAWAQVTDPEITKGIKQVEDGDYDAAILTLDNAARHLSTDPSKAKDLSQAYLYLGIAYVGKGHDAAAKAKFREAIAQIKDLTLSPDKYPPKVIDVFEAAKEEEAKSPTAKAPEKKGGSHTALYVLGGVAVAGGIGIAAASGGGSSGTTTTTTLPNLTKSYGPIGLAYADYCFSQPYTFFANRPGTFSANITWKESYAILAMYLFDNANDFSNGTNPVAQSNQTSNTAASLTQNVTGTASTPKEYWLGICHTGNSCNNVSSCSATFTLTVTCPCNP
jgi:hypothetical protein